jgi:hypothetical protein
MEKLFKTLSSIIWFVLFVAFISWYVQTWFGALKNGNILLFLVMSILPVCVAYNMCVEAFAPNVYHDMVDAQINAWKNQ